MSPQFRIVLAQIGVTAGVVAVALVAGWGAVSALLGGGVSVCGTGYAAYAHHRRWQREESPPDGRLVWRGMVAVVLQKWLLVAALCVSVFTLYPSLAPVPFFVAMLATAVAYLWGE